MKVTRRGFLKITGASAAGAVALGLGIDLKPIESHAQTLKIRYAKETTSICCYCAVGCGVIVHTGKAGAGKVTAAAGYALGGSRSFLSKGVPQRIHA